MDHCLKEKIKKETGLKKDELGGKIMAKLEREKTKRLIVT